MNEHRTGPADLTMHRSVGNVAKDQEGRAISRGIGGGVRWTSKRDRCGGLVAGLVATSQPSAIGATISGASAAIRTASSALRVLLTVPDISPSLPAQSRHWASSARPPKTVHPPAFPVRPRHKCLAFVSVVWLVYVFKF